MEDLEPGRVENAEEVSTLAVSEAGNDPLLFEKISGSTAPLARVLFPALPPSAVRAAPEPCGAIGKRQNLTPVHPAKMVILSRHRLYLLSARARTPLVVAEFHLNGAGKQAPISFLASALLAFTTISASSRISIPHLRHINLGWVVAIISRPTLMGTIEVCPQSSYNSPPHFLCFTPGHLVIQIFLTE